MLRCIHCGNYTATLQILVATVDLPSENYAVCDDCVERIERQALGALTPLAPSSLLKRIMTTGEEGPSFHCPSCGYDLEDVVRTGKLGCRQCYLHFEEEVMGLVRRAIGREKHRGKMPPQRIPPSYEEE